MPIAVEFDREINVNIPLWILLRQIRVSKDLAAFQPASRFSFYLVSVFLFFILYTYAVLGKRLVASFQTDLVVDVASLDPLAVKVSSLFVLPFTYTLHV